MELIAWAPITEEEQIPPLGEALQRHILSYENSKKRHASLSAWNLLARKMNEQGLSLLPVCFEEGGKPYFPGIELYFSLSHSGKLCAVSISDRPTGIDIERIKASYPPALVTRSLSEKERASYEGNFARFWCRKEAAGKLTGEGILYPPCKIDTLALPYVFEERSISYGGDAYYLAAAFSPVSPEKRG